MTASYQSCIVVSRDILLSHYRDYVENRYHRGSELVSLNWRALS